MPVLTNAELPDQEAFFLALERERRFEFAFERKRWFDLVRTGNLEAYVKRAKGDKANPQPFNYVFPIPQREMDLNQQLVQNDQY